MNTSFQSRRKWRAVGAFPVCLTAIGWHFSPVQAADFYSGKIITIVVSTEAGTGFDSYARLIAENMPRHIPGQPRFIVQYMPGAAGLKATNYIYATAPKDGTVIAATHGSIPTAALLAQQGVQYDASKLNWLGSITKDPFVGFIWHESPARQWQDFYTMEVTMGTEAVGSASADFPILSHAILGTKIKSIFGYKSSTESRLAVERGEVMGNFATTYSSLRSLSGDMLRDGRFRIVIQHGLTKIPELSNVPLLIDQAKNEDDRRLLEVFLARQETGKPYFLPPGVPADRVALLQEAFMATLKDEEFVRETQRGQLDISGPMSGPEVKALVERVSSAPLTIVDRIKKVFSDFANGAR